MAVLDSIGSIVGDAGSRARMTPGVDTFGSSSRLVAHDPLASARVHLPDGRELATTFVVNWAWLTPTHWRAGFLNPETPSCRLLLFGELTAITLSAPHRGAAWRRTGGCRCESR